MADKKKKKAIKTSEPSKAYLVSFGDTMTALLAFFIVLNSLAKEQTGAAMYSGTGSFARAFKSKSGSAGMMPGNRSKYVIQAAHPKPIYGLQDNLEKNEETERTKGPDDEGDERIMDRDQEQFQKFLKQMQQVMDVKEAPTRVDQTVVDAFGSIINDEGKFSKQAEELITRASTHLRRSDTSVELIFWAKMPSPAIFRESLDESVQVRDKIYETFWIREDAKDRFLIRVKPWLFADAKRPIYSLVFSRLSE